ncbi:hypothetical protein Bbelb_389200 [Branchiostoma belcheri]|nr:hypothetical protein Bbelb_389200 [Branchiostoma belcheri]
MRPYLQPVVQTSRKMAGSSDRSPPAQYRARRGFVRPAVDTHGDQRADPVNASVHKRRAGAATRRVNSATIPDDMLLIRRDLCRESRPFVRPCRACNTQHDCGAGAGNVRSRRNVGEVSRQTGLVSRCFANTRGFVGNPPTRVVRCQAAGMLSLAPADGYRQSPPNFWRLEASGADGITQPCDVWMAGQT